MSYADNVKEQQPITSEPASIAEFARVQRLSQSLHGVVEILEKRLNRYMIGNSPEKASEEKLRKVPESAFHQDVYETAQALASLESRLYSLERRLTI